MARINPAAAMRSMTPRTPPAINHVLRCCGTDKAVVGRTDTGKLPGVLAVSPLGPSPRGVNDSPQVGQVMRRPSVRTPVRIALQ
jgi:hypothetical protein